jgi:hypothetical protein
MEEKQSHLKIGSNIALALKIKFIPSFMRYLLFLDDPKSFLDTRGTSITLSIRRGI